MKLKKAELKKLIRTGYEKKLVRIIYANALKNNGCEGIACRIGDNCFYFAGHTGEEFENINDYLKNTNKDNNINAITEAIIEIYKEIDPEEAKYYISYLKENLTTIPKPTSTKTLERHLVRLQACSPKKSMTSMMPFPSSRKQMIMSN